MKPCYVDRESWTTVELSALTDDLYYINRVITPRLYRGKGHASRLMQQVLDDADSDGASLVLEINPYGPMTHKALEVWYLRLGFKKVGRNLYKRSPKEQV